MEAVKTQTPQAEETFDIFKMTAWLHANLKTVIASIVAIAVICMAVALYFWKQNQNEVAASEALAAQPGVLLSKTEVHPNADALLKIGKEYSGTMAGARAQLLGAEALFIDGKYEQSKSEFLKFLESHSSSPFVAQANYGVAASTEALGKTDEAIKLYQDIIAKFPSSGVAGPAKLTVARLFEEQNKPDQALKTYNDLTRNSSPYDPWASEAAERRELLLSKHPELRPAPVATTPAATAPKITIPAAASKTVTAPPVKATNATTTKKK